MTIMQGQSAVLWELITLGLFALSALCIWFVVIVGRDQRPSKQQRGEDTVEHYGDIAEDRAPVSKFLKYTYIGLAIWAVGYAIFTGIYGLY